MATITTAEMQARIGTETVSDWVEVTQAMIDKFADATGDHQFIHVDPTRAAQTPFGGTIAHGFLTLEPDCEVTYKVSSLYAPDCDGGVRWDSCGIDWPMPAGTTPELSAKDVVLPTLADFDSPFPYDGRPLAPLA